MDISRIFTFKVEWFNPESEIVKEFLLTYYETDNSLQMFDLKHRRPFLRRMKIPNIRLEMFYKYSKVNILSRLIEVVEYGDLQTFTYFEEKHIRVFFLVKPGGMNIIGKIIKFLEEEGFMFVDMKIGLMEYERAKELFTDDDTNESNDQSLHSVIKAVAETPCLAINTLIEADKREWCLEHDINQRDSVDVDPEKSSGVDFIRNYTFIRSKKEDQKKAANIWFPKETGPSIPPYVRLANTTCCIIKPHILRERNVGNVIDFIYSNGFEVTGLQLMTFSRDHIYQFLKYYIGSVLDQASADEFISGSCVALEIADTNKLAESVTSFRKLAGFIDPTLGIKAQPNTIRAKFGTTLTTNAVHATDLPEHVGRELKYIFKTWAKYN